LWGREFVSFGVGVKCQSIYSDPDYPTPIIRDPDPEWWLET
jgi:hypothetical protein